MLKYARVNRHSMSTHLRGPKQEAFCSTVSWLSSGQWEGGQAAFTHETHSCWPSSIKLLSFCPRCFSYGPVSYAGSQHASFKLVFLSSGASGQTKAKFHLWRIKTGRVRELCKPSPDEFSTIWLNTQSAKHTVLGGLLSMNPCLTHMHITQNTCQLYFLLYESQWFTLWFGPHKELLR